ncbi:MAG: hypothetical protein ACI4NQ_04255 [Christensenellales bacterium]
MDGRPRARAVVRQSAFIGGHVPSFPHTDITFEIQVTVLIQLYGIKTCFGGFGLYCKAYFDFSVLILCKAGQIATAIVKKHISILHGIIIIKGERAGGNSVDTAKTKAASFFPFIIVNIDKSSYECGIISMIVRDGNHIDQMTVSC